MKKRAIAGTSAVTVSSFRLRSVFGSVFKKNRGFGFGSVFLPLITCTKVDHFTTTFALRSFTTYLTRTRKFGITDY